MTRRRNATPKMSRAQVALAREIDFTNDCSAENLARRVGTTLSGATYSLRVMNGNGWTRENLSGNWSLTEAGDAAFEEATA